MVIYLLTIFLLASVVAAAMRASSPCIPNTCHLSPGLQAPFRIIHIHFPLLQVKIEQINISLWSSS